MKSSLEQQMSRLLGFFRLPLFGWMFFGTLTTLIVTRVPNAQAILPYFYSTDGKEYAVEFQGLFATYLDSIEKIQAMSDEAKSAYNSTEILPSFKFLFGPLAYRHIGAPQRGASVEIDWSSATLENGRVLLPYRYAGTWIIDKRAVSEVPIEIPVPRNPADLSTRAWKNCTDSAPEHQFLSMLWYFWDPARPGCDYQAGRHYDLVKVKLGQATQMQTLTYPEYGRLQSTAGSGDSTKRQLKMTFAFGYVETPAQPDPERDEEYGIQQYRAFVKYVRELSSPTLSWQETPILQGEYRFAVNPQLQIGHRFTAQANGTELVVKVVAAAGIDQMELFAQSYAHDHDGFFSWFGHSRLGSGFDPAGLAQRLEHYPEYYSISPQYQLLYWAGCDSYSYYTQPFFELKAKASNGQDPQGTQGLDIIANGLPSYFGLNTENAIIALDALLQLEQGPSYQTIIDKIEAAAHQLGVSVLAAVLGDEDNPPRP